MFRKTYVFTLLAFCLLGGFFEAAALAKDKYKITVVVHGGLTDPFWQMQERGLKDLQAQIPDLEVSYRGPQLYDFEKFKEILRDAVQEKPDALVCTLTDPQFMDEILRPAIAGGLPVIAINAADLREPAGARIPVLTYIGEDSYQIGVTAATEMLQRFTPKRALFCNHQPGADNIRARGRGWVETMEKRGIPAEQIDISADPSAGMQILAAYLLKHPETDAIFMTNAARTQATISRLEADGYKIGKTLKFAQMDVDPVIVDYLKQDKILFTLDQQPYLQSYLGVMLAYLHVKYGITPPPAPISTGPGIITKDNLPASPESVKAQKAKIAVVVHGSQTDPFWKPVQRGIKDAAALYPDLEVTYTGTDVYSVEAFMQNITTALDSKPDALICTLTAPPAMDAALRKVITAGLPVIAINAPDLRQPVSERIPVLTYIGEDSYQIGVTAAAETLKQVTPKRAVFFNHQEGAANLEARGQGWVDAMTERKVAAEAVIVPADAMQAAERVAKYLQEHPETDALFISNTGVTQAVVERLTANGVNVGQNIKIAQMDVSAEILEYIQDGKLMFTLDQQPYLQGYLSVVLAYSKVKQQLTPPPAPLSTGPAVVTKADINPAKGY